MAKKTAKPNTMHLTTTTAAPEREFQRHLTELGFTNVEAYRQWCRKHGFRTTTTQKDWQARRQERNTMERLRAEEVAQAENERHYRSLGFASREAYHQWCDGRGFSHGLRKTDEQRDAERVALLREKAQTTLVRGNRHLRKPEEKLQAVLRGELVPDPGQSEALYLVWRHARDMEDGHERGEREAFARLVLHVHKKGDLLRDESVIPHFGYTDGNTYPEALSALAAHYKDWLRPIEDWKPESHNARKQFASLARHLFAKYAVPPFLDSVWFAGSDNAAVRQRKWFLHVGIGKNIRTADLPVRLTEKAAHHFQFAPPDSSVFAALRWGQMRAMGAGPNLIRAVVGTLLGQSFENEEFWVSVLHFFVNNPMLDLAQIGPIVDFIQYRKFTPQLVPQPDGTVLNAPPEPQFSMKGRTPDALLRRVQEWHRTLAQEQKQTVREWWPSGIKPLELRDKNAKEGCPLMWTIREICTIRELREEGRAMHHCVGTYADSCLNGRLSIWSVRVKEGDGLPRRVMTLAVHNAQKVIVEARGKCNKLPGGRHSNPRLDAVPPVLHAWMNQEELRNTAYMG